MEKELNKLIYDQKDVCEAFKENGLESALQIIKTKREKLIFFMTDVTPRTVMLGSDHHVGDDRMQLQKKLLNSINRCLYYYTTLVLNVSSSDCLYHSMKGLYSDMSKGAFMESARNVLETYKPFIHPDEAQNKHIEEACFYIQNHLNEELSLERVASQIYVGRCHLCWLFRNCKQVNFSEYVTGERVKLAKKLLADESLSIDLVAEKCGFSSSSYFSTVFKKKEGLSPRDYRKKCLLGNS